LRDAACSASFSTKRQLERCFDLKKPSIMSIQALADSLSISISTVSRALNGYTDVSAATRQRVMDAAKAMNYSPHPAAHRLATGKTGAVAIINSARSPDAIDGSGAMLHTGLANALRPQGYFVVSMVLPGDASELPELERLLGARMFDGVVLTRTRTRDERVDLLQERQIPFLTYGRTLNIVEHAWVDADHEGVMEQAVQALALRGHQSIALLHGAPGVAWTHFLCLGFTRALEACRLQAPACPKHELALTGPAAYEQTRLLLKSKDAPSAIICESDVMALGAMAAIREAGLTVGRDVSVIGYGNTQAGQYAAPTLSTVARSIYDSGAAVAQTMLALLSKQPSKASPLETSRLILRDSVGRRA
jgi:LacI family transcriptional regulator